MTFVHLNVHSHFSKGWGLCSVEELCQCAREYGMDRLALTDTNGLYGLIFFIRAAKEAGIKDMILLDLARVGAAAGPPLTLLDSLQPHFPDLAFYAGGGARHRADLDALARAGAAGALIATAFHRGVLTAGDVDAYQG